MEKINIKRLAEELNLSISTISRALHDSHEISAETKKRVLHLATELAYVPNHHASGLRMKVSKTIAVVIPEVADSYFAKAINGIESEAQKNGYHVLIYLTHESYAKEKAILKELQCGRVDGVLLSVTAETLHSGHIQELLSHGMPLVFFDRVCEEIETAKITTNDFESGYKATEHLIQGGCRNIAILLVSKSLAMSGQRLQGYQQALKDHHLSLQASNIVFCTNEDEQDQELLRHLLQPEGHPDGLIATVENLTTSIYLACASLQLAIPRDVKVVSFSNLPTALLLNPSLTTITQPAFDMGRTAAALLFKALKKKKINLKAESQVLPSSLIIRNSTAAE